MNRIDGRQRERHLDEVCDVAIVGSGPAGATVARALAGAREREFFTDKANLSSKAKIIAVVKSSCTGDSSKKPFRRSHVEMV